MDKKNRKFNGTEIKEYGLCQYKSNISINDIDINKTVVSNKILNISLVTKILKKLDFYQYSAHEWIYINFPWNWTYVFYAKR